MDKNKFFYSLLGLLVGFVLLVVGVWGSKKMIYAAIPTNSVQPVIEKAISFDVETLYKQLSNGMFQADAISQKQFWKLRDYIKKNKLWKTLSINAIHELGKAYRALGKKNALEADLQKKTDQPASKNVVDAVHGALKQMECPAWDVPVYKLDTKKRRVLGETGYFAIWIAEDMIGADQVELIATCVHEAGHWHYQHILQFLFDDEASTEEMEFQADEFMMRVLPESIRDTIIARAVYSHNPDMVYAHKKEHVDLLKPVVVQGETGFEYILRPTTMEHARNVVEISRSHKYTIPVLTA